MSRFVALTGWALIIGVSVGASLTQAQVVAALASDYLRIPPGQSGEVVIAAVNRGANLVPSMRFADFGSPPGYTYESLSGPGCGPIVQMGFDTTFDVINLGPGERRECHFRLTRAATTIDNAFAIWGSEDLTAPYERAVFSAGSLANISLSAETVSFDLDADRHASAVVRLTVTNAGPDAVGYISAETCDIAAAPLRVESVVPGGCEITAVNNCNFLLPGFTVRLPAAPVSTTDSCLIRIRSEQAFTAAVNLPLWPSELRSPLEGWMSDPVRDGDSALIHIGPSGGPAPTAAPSLGVNGVIALILALIALAGLSLRRRRQHELQDRRL